MVYIFAMQFNYFVQTTGPYITDDLFRDLGISKDDQWIMTNDPSWEEGLMEMGLDRRDSQGRLTPVYHLPLTQKMLATLSANKKLISRIMASVVKADATRIGTSGYTDPDIAYTAFENKDGSFSFIVTNSSASEKPFNINSETKSFSYKLPANSIVSFQWGK